MSPTIAAVDGQSTTDHAEATRLDAAIFDEHFRALTRDNQQVKGVFAPTIGAALALVVHGVLRGLYSPLYDAWINRGLNPASRATVNSIASQADALGQVVFGPVFGLLGNVLGVRSALALAALVRVPALGVLGRAGEKGDGSTSP